MKKSIICGAVVMLLGLLIALGPQFLFKVCGHGEDNFPQCHWSAQAELGVGFLIFLLGVGMLIFKDQRALLGLAVGSFLAGFVALFIPHTLIGGCTSMAMKCRRVAFPALTAESIVLLVSSGILVVYIEMKNRVRIS